MQFHNVTQSNIDFLYALNKQLTVDENQADLFVAKKEDYKQAFLDTNPIAFGLLVYEENEPIGFVVCSKKFATYLASKVLWIEDIYLQDQHRTRQNMAELLQYMIKRSKTEQHARLEMRVLDAYSFDAAILEQNGFHKISKWSTYRFES